MHIDDDRFKDLVEKVDKIMTNHLPHIYAEQIRNTYRFKTASVIGIIAFVLLVSVPDSAPFWDAIGRMLGMGA